MEILRIGLDTPRRQRAAWREARAERDFDARHGVNTAGFTELSELEIDSPDRDHGVRYQPVRLDVFRAALRRLNVPFEDFAFVDYGSGKGKALLLASELPFRRIIGVEFAPELHRVAERNVAAFRSPRQRCRDIESVCTDATAFELPPENVVLYFYNPFREPVMRELLEGVRRSAAAHHREVVAIVEGPEDHLETFRRAGFLLRRSEPSLYNDSMWASTWLSMELALEL